MRTRILRILKFPKIHEFLRILKLSLLKFIKFKLYLSPQSSSKLFVANIALKFWREKNSVMSTIQDSLTRQQFSIITSSLLQSLRIACSFTCRISANRSPASRRGNISAPPADDNWSCRATGSAPTAEGHLPWPVRRCGTLCLTI